MSFARVRVINIEKGAVSGSFFYIATETRSGNDVADRLHDEGEIVVAVRHHVLAHRNGTPAVYAAETHLLLVYEQVGEGSFGYFLRVSLGFGSALVEAFHRVVER